MKNLVDRILQGIESGESEAFLAANEYGRAFVCGCSENVGLIEPYDQELSETPPTEAGANLIRAALKKTIRESMPGQGRGVKALSSFRNEDDLEFFEDMLQLQLEECMRSNSALGQLVIAISDSGGQILRTSSFSTSDPTRFITDAQHYLHEKTGRLNPW